MSEKANITKARKVLQFNLSSQQELEQFEMLLNKLQFQESQKVQKILSVPEAVKKILEEIAK